MKLSIDSTSASFSINRSVNAAITSSLRSIPPFRLLGDLDLDLTFGDDDKTVADIFRLQTMMLHRCGDALIHGVAVIFEIDQHHPERSVRNSVVQQLSATGHRQCLDNAFAALAGTASRSGTTNLPA